MWIFQSQSECKCNKTGHLARACQMNNTSFFGNTKKKYTHHQFKEYEVPSRNYENELDYNIKLTEQVKKIVLVLQLRLMEKKVV